DQPRVRRGALHPARAAQQRPRRAGQARGIGGQRAGERLGRGRAPQRSGGLLGKDRRPVAREDPLVSALDRAYQNMTDAQAMTFAPPGEQPAWDEGVIDDDETTVDQRDDHVDDEKTVDWIPTDLGPGKGEKE